MALQIEESLQRKSRPRTDASDIELIVRVELKGTVTAQNVSNKRECCLDLYLGHGIVVAPIALVLDPDRPVIGVRRAGKPAISCNDPVVPGRITFPHALSHRPVFSHHIMRRDLASLLAEPVHGTGPRCP